LPQQSLTCLRTRESRGDSRCEGEGPGDPCEAQTAICESMYGKAPKHMTAASVLRVCEKVLGLPGDVD